MEIEKTGKLIAGRRKELEMIQLELASLLGVTNMAVSRSETGAGFPDVSLFELYYSKEIHGTTVFACSLQESPYLAFDVEL